MSDLLEYVYVVVREDGHIYGVAATAVAAKKIKDKYKYDGHKITIHTEYVHY